MSADLISVLADLIPVLVDPTPVSGDLTPVSGDLTPAIQRVTSCPPTGGRCDLRPTGETVPIRSGDLRLSALTERTIPCGVFLSRQQQLAEVFCRPVCLVQNGPVTPRPAELFKCHL